MKKVLFLVIAGGLFCCKNTVIYKKEEGIAYKETVVLSDVPKATLTFFEVEDSRCPEGVQCVWAGNATVDLLLTGVTTEGGVNQHVKMCLGNCSGRGFVAADTLEKKFAGNEYRLILSAVTPAPKADVPVKKENYSVHLKIEKK